MSKSKFVDKVFTDHPFMMLKTLKKQSDICCTANSDHFNQPLRRKMSLVFLGIEDGESSSDEWKHSSRTKGESIFPQPPPPPSWSGRKARERQTQMEAEQAEQAAAEQAAEDENSEEQDITEELKEVTTDVSLIDQLSLARLWSDDEQYSYATYLYSILAERFPSVYGEYNWRSAFLYLAWAKSMLEESIKSAAANAAPESNEESQQSAENPVDEDAESESNADGNSRLRAQTPMPPSNAESTFRDAFSAADVARRYLDCCLAAQDATFVPMYDDLRQQMVRYLNEQYGEFALPDAGVVNRVTSPSLLGKLSSDNDWNFELKPHLLHTMADSLSVCAQASSEDGQPESV